MPISEVYNCDCIEFMRTMPDKKFDLVIADPPYGLKRFERGDLRMAKGQKYENGIEWDKKPQKQFFDELLRTSKKCIIWGANNFELPPTEYFIVWNKEQTVDNFASAEYAWTNIEIPAKVFNYAIHKCNADNKKNGKIHPTQKPIALYCWLLNTYGGGCKTIFDPMMGSQSSRIAAYKAGFDYYGCELDKEYFEKGNERFEKECKGIIRTKNGKQIQQLTLF